MRRELSWALLMRFVRSIFGSFRCDSLGGLEAGHAFNYWERIEGRPFYRWSLQGIAFHALLNWNLSPLPAAKGHACNFLSMTWEPLQLHLGGYGGSSHPSLASATPPAPGRPHEPPVPNCAAQTQLQFLEISRPPNCRTRASAPSSSESRRGGHGLDAAGAGFLGGGGAQAHLEGPNGHHATRGQPRREATSSPAPLGTAPPDLAAPESAAHGAPRGALVAERDDHAAPARCSDAVVYPAAEESRESAIQREFAHHHPGVARLNNGSFGSAPKQVLDDQAEWNLRWLRHPDAFCWDPLSEGFLAARTGLAELIGGPDVNEVVLLENATTGAAVVAVDCMWGFLEGRYARGDGIVMFDSAYGAVKKCFQGYCVRAGAQILEYKMPFPVASSEEIVGTFEEFLRKEKADNPACTIRLAVLDHITSMPSIILPIRDLVRVCRAHGVEQVFVDGAHAIGSVDINVHDIDADYYTANAHKWLFAPPVAAFFHAKPHHLSRLHHPVISHRYGTGLLSESYWVGTRDYSALLAVPKAIGFVKEFFGDLQFYRKSNHDKVVEMGEMLARSWGTCLGAPPYLFASMVMVGLPPGLNIHSQDDASKMRSRLREEFHVEVPLCYTGDFTSHMDGSKVVAYARISHQVYNKPEDYYAFRDAVNMILALGA